MSTPRPTAVALLATLAVTAGAVAAFLAGSRDEPRPYLALFTALFAVRVAGQLVVLAWAPVWLPPMKLWNLAPYRLLLPAQLVLLAVMVALVAGTPAPSPVAALGLVALAYAYWAAMAVRYAVRMSRRPDQRWLGGAIPMVFHCVLAAFLFVLGWGG